MKTILTISLLLLLFESLQAQSLPLLVSSPIATENTGEGGGAHTINVLFILKTNRYSCKLILNPLNTKILSAS
jgi:hypothetical protein